MRSSPTRVLDEYLDSHGNIAVTVTLGGGTNLVAYASARPLTVARWLRELADDVERLA